MKEEKKDIVWTSQDRGLANWEEHGQFLLHV
jgi:hypothetical protein